MTRELPARSITLDDLMELIKRNRRAILSAAWLGATIAALIALSLPVTYLAEGTFRDRGTRSNAGMSSSAGSGNVLSALMSDLGASADQDLVSLFKSRQLSAPVIEQLGLQVRVKEQIPFSGWLGRLWGNTYAEVAHLLQVKTPVVSGPVQYLDVVDVHYAAEIPANFVLTFESPTKYRLEDAQGQRLGLGKLGQPFVSSDIAFTIKAGTSTSLDGAVFHLEANPMGPLAEKLARRLKVKSVEKREKIQRISFDYPDRQKATQFVNGLMESYQDYAKSENRRVASSQHEYLQARARESFADLQAFMSEYASTTSANVSATGVFDTEKELEYLLKARLECCTKLTESDLESRRLQGIDVDGGAEYRTLAAVSGLPVPVVDALGQLRELSRRRDVLKVVLQDVPVEDHPDLHGIDLRTAEEVFLALNTQRSQVESEIKQTRFILDQLQDPDFAISSLAGSIMDPVGREIVSRASTAELNLRDSGNRSEREQERLRETLSQQRAFLDEHLNQSNELLVLREDFLKQKTIALQQVLYNLLQQQIGISEQHLQDYLGARMGHLQQEKGLLQQTLDGLRQQMALLPTRWAAEQMVLQRMKLNKTLVEEIGRFVESKTISNNLENMQSGPVDLALAPILPRQPYALLFAVLGGILGALGSSGALMMRNVSRGMPVSLHYLTTAGQLVAGTLHREGLQWIDLLRRIGSQLSIAPGDNVLMMTGHGPDYSWELAQLLQRCGWKVLRISLHGGRQAEAASSTSIRPGQGCDELVFGGEGQYVSEWLRSQQFTTLLQELHQSYEVLLLVSPAVADSAEAESLALQFPKAVVTVGQERMQDLAPLFRHPQITFVV